MTTARIPGGRVPLPSARSWTATEDLLGFFGPDSVTWRLHADPSYPVGGLRALMLQTLHPVAMDGVARNSAAFRDEPWQRLVRTGQYVETLTYGTRTEARRLVSRIRGVHGGLGGTEETSGRTYRVDDPDLLLWVHHCEVDSWLSTARRAGMPLTDADADRYLTEQVTAATLIGVPADCVARSVTELDAYFVGMRPVLTASPAARDAIRRILLPPMPAWVQLLTPARPAWGGLAGLGFALLPGWARRKFSMPGSRATDLAATAAVRALRQGLVTVPPRLRNSPTVRAAYDRVAPALPVSA